MKKAICIVGEAAPSESIDKLKDDFKVYILPRDTSIADPVSSHPDMILTIIKNKLFCHKNYFEKNRVLLEEIALDAGLDIVTSECKRSSDYPEDIAFNVLCADDNIIGKADSIAPELKCFDIVNTRQGYAGCTSLFAGGYIVSADPAILKSAKSASIPFQKISGEGIILTGYDKGFIGGACGVFHNNVYICGDPMKCPAGKDLVAFCKKASLNLISMFSGDVTDIGGIKFAPFAVAK